MIYEEEQKRTRQEPTETNGIESTEARDELEAENELARED